MKFSANEIRFAGMQNSVWLNIFNASVSNTDIASEREAT
jgi:hypothetical protein